MHFSLDLLPCLLASVIFRPRYKDRVEFAAVRVRSEERTKLLSINYSFELLSIEQLSEQNSDVWMGFTGVNSYIIICICLLFTPKTSSINDEYSLDKTSRSCWTNQKCRGKYFPFVNCCRAAPTSNAGRWLVAFVGQHIPDVFDKFSAVIKRNDHNLKNSLLSADSPCLWMFI